MGANKTLRLFRIVLDYGIRYYPLTKGISILFQKDSRRETPLQVACNKFKQNYVMDVVEETLVRYYSPTTPINSMDALMLAAIDEHIHLDGVYFVLRGQPDVLTRMLPPRLTNNNNNSNITCDQDSTVNDNDDDDHDDDHDENDIVNLDYDADGNNDSKIRKRKGWN